jgi:carboxyl-terminal processing protease
VKVKSIPLATIVDPVSGIGYIRMTGFQKTTAVELDAALLQLQRDGMQALIWDLRGNPGGLLTAAVEVLDRFIDDGVLVSTKGRTSDQNWTYTAKSSVAWRGPMVLLVDSDSASASEIVAGCLKDHARAEIVGRKTYGKWSVQSILPGRAETGLRITTAKFYSPSGRTYGKIGIEPDIQVPDPADEHVAAYRGRRVDLENDRDLDMAIQRGRQKLAQASR